MKLISKKHLSSRGFTLVELLVVIVIIVTLMGILIPVVGGARKQAVKTQAKNALTTLVTSVDTYYATYNILPSSNDSAPTQDEEIETIEPIMSVLAGINLNNLNRKQIPFFSGDVAKGNSRATAYNGLRLTGSTAELYDPWKKKGANRGYILFLDYNYDQRLIDPFSQGDVIPRRAVAWSSGKDGLFNGSHPKRGENEDNVYSWF